MSNIRLNRGDELCIFFKNEDAAPYRMFGSFLTEDDTYYRISGTVGDNIGKEFFIPKTEVKMIEVIKRRRADS